MGRPYPRQDATGIPNMIVDLHTHRWESPDQLGSAAATILRSIGSGSWDQFDTSGGAHEQAAKPVRFAVIHGFVSAYLGAHIDNEQVASYVSHRPEKFLGFAGIDPMIDGYLQEFDKALELGLVGVTISPAAQNFHPTHTRAMALYERCEQGKVPVFVHPDTHMGNTTKLEFAHPHLFDEVARTFPNLPLILAQIGHPWVEQTLHLIGKHPHVYADLSDLIRRPWQLYNTLLSAYQQNVCNHLLLGSDFPFCTPKHAIKNIYDINTLAYGTALPTVPREQLRGIVERDTLACLGIKPPTAAVTTDSPVDTSSSDRPAKMSHDSSPDPDQGMDPEASMTTDKSHEQDSGQSDADESTRDDSPSPATTPSARKNLG